MRFLYHDDPRFLDGLKQHGFPIDDGRRLLNTGMVPSIFGQRWAGSEALNRACAAGLPFHLDRITGGAPFQPLDGITPIAQSLATVPHFLGFQAHEWDGSPLHDYRRIHKWFLDKGIPFDEANFESYAGRTSMPYFSGGNFATYRDLLRPMKSATDLQGYFEDYFRQLITLTAGQVLSVNGIGQFYHAALRLGARHVMTEIGNQIPLTALQLACIRGAARQYGKPWGVYYETWGGEPFGCTCATSFSPWFGTPEQLKAFHDMGCVGPHFGSSRSLQNRLLYFSWLSGSEWWSEEWGAENYFSDWDHFPLTEYGRLSKAFIAATREQGHITPIVPAAIILPPDTLGFDNVYLAGAREQLFDQVDPTPFHALMRTFFKSLYATQPVRPGGDAHNLTSSPWIGCFDVLSADAPPSLLDDYAVTVFFDQEQMDSARHSNTQRILYSGREDQVSACLETVAQVLPFQIHGEIGCVQARTEERILVGLFNNLGVTKLAGQETLDPTCTRQIKVEGACAGLSWICGDDFLRHADKGEVTLELPPGAVAVLSFPSDPELDHSVFRVAPSRSRSR